MPPVHKVIVTNGAALRAKYGPDFDVATTVKPLLDKDATRDLGTRVADLSSTTAMKEFTHAAVKATDRKANKTAIDAIHKKIRPQYLVILGSVDVVPHQNLKNPTPDDGDPNVPGDLPYACEAAYSTSPSAFRAPTRVVGRLPDETGASRPDLLKAVIGTAAKRRQRSRAAYDPYLGITALVWKNSTALSLRRLAGSSADLKSSPTAGPKWAAALAARRTHFVNCHGGPADPHFYGQKGGAYPVAHDAAYLEGKISEGTIAAVECCYGAELYDPVEAGVHRGIVSTYLANGAYAFLGSSNIAYGPSAGNGSADLICRFFLERVLAGASLGRAALEARQRFVRETNVLDPADLKTLAQFSLMGDPSNHPVAPAAKPKALGDPAAARDARRANLAAQGLALETSRSYAEPRRTARKASGRAIERGGGGGGRGARPPPPPRPCLPTPPPPGGGGGPPPPGRTRCTCSSSRSA